MTPQQFDAIEKRILHGKVRTKGLFDRFSESRMKQRPSAEAWSAVECVVHLILTNRATLPRIQAAVNELRARGLTSTAPDCMNFAGWLVRVFLEPPPRFKTRTGRPFLPQVVDPYSTIPSDFERELDLLLETFHEARGLNLSTTKIVSPFDARVKYNVYAAFRILETHLRRHLWQAEAALGL